MKIDSLMKITRRNAVLCVLWVVFVLSLPIYVFGRYSITNTCIRGQKSFVAL